MAEVSARDSEAQRATRDPEQIEVEIERTRDEFADTVAALADKVDVKKKAKHGIAEAKSHALPLAIGGAVIVALGALWIRRR
jgi:Protein of unknown function (DUF3618)